MKAAKSKTITKLSDLIPDDANFNTGTEFGNSLIEKSLTRFGAGRSILIDKHGRIIAGNKTVENAVAVGIEDVEVIQTDGKRIIAVQRMDVDLDTKKGRELALADNATAKANIAWDFGNLERLEMPTQEWGVFLPEDMPNLDHLFTDAGEPKDDDKHAITLHYTAEDFKLVSKALLTHAKTYEAAVWELLGL